jgi:hypothetical protein
MANETCVEVEAPESIPLGDPEHMDALMARYDELLLEIDTLGHQIDAILASISVLAPPQPSGPVSDPKSR